MIPLQRGTFVKGDYGVAFPLGDYVALLAGLRDKGYALGPVARYFEGVEAPFVFLRHDVDRLPARAAAAARAEHELGLCATYYFRCDANQRFPEAAIREVAALGHEVGFHYETAVRVRGDVAALAELFAIELAALRRIAEVKTIAAHGSPLSRHSNMDSAPLLNYRALGIVGDPREDFDFSKVMYITDTGGVFGSPNNRRDKVNGRQWATPTPPRALFGQLDPMHEPHVLLSTHPERWATGAFGTLAASTLDAGINIAKRFAQR